MTFAARLSSSAFAILLPKHTYATFMQSSFSTSSKFFSAKATQERTFIAIKPDGVQRRLVGKIIQRFEDKGLKLVGMKQLTASKKQLEEHYIDLKQKKFFVDHITYMGSGPIVAMVWEGQNAVNTGRKMLGATNPHDAPPGTIRGDYCMDVGRNVCHGSDSVISAEKEIALWFEPSELNDWKNCTDDWINE